MAGLLQRSFERMLLLGMLPLLMHSNDLIRLSAILFTKSRQLALTQPG